MPRWAKALSVGLGVLALCVTVVFATVAYLVNSAFSGFSEGFSETFAGSGTADGGDGRETIRFLDPTVFDPQADGAAVVLHPLATGLETSVIVTDPSVLAAAAEAGVYYTDNRRAEARLVLASIMFFSPPGTGTRRGFAELYQDGVVIGRFDCFAVYCNAPDHDRDLAGLLEAAEPVAFDLEELTGYAQALARRDEVRRDPSLFLRSEAPEPVGGRWPGYVTVDLPGTLVLTSGPAYMATAEVLTETEINAALEQLGVAGEMRRYHTGESNISGMIVARDGGAALTDADGWLVNFDRVQATSVRFRFWTDAENAARLQDARRELGRLVNSDRPTQAEWDAALARFLDERNLGIAPADYQLSPDILAGLALREDTNVSPLRQDRYLISYLRLDGGDGAP